MLTLSFPLFFFDDIFSYSEFSLGLAFDPMDTQKDIDVYFTASHFFHKGAKSSSGSAVNGRIRKASGPNLETVVDIISGLPVSDIDHGLNAVEFGDNGEIYFAIGSNTNGGLPGPLSTSRLLKENYLSGAIVVAYVNHPDFQGHIKWTAEEDGDMIASGIDIYAHGVRNAYSILRHSNGNMYTSDNGPNVGYGRMMTGCDEGQDIQDNQRDDKFLLIKQGAYYGHPNPKRASYLKDTRQCVWHGAEETSNSGYTGPMLVATSSRTGLVEFAGNHFGGQLRGHIIMEHYTAQQSLSRLILNDDGTGLVPESLAPISLDIGDQGLDVTLAPNGNLIEVRYVPETVAYYKPYEKDTDRLIVKSVFPHRGRSSGGTILSIYGVNFVSLRDGSNPIVTVGGLNCPTIPTITATRIDCTLPGGFGTVDIVVTTGSSSSTFEKGYKYISGTLPPGFTLPVHK
jgi:glucose/arabinose dehydrogenase